MFVNTLSIGQWSVASWVKQEKDTSGEDEGNDDDDDGVTDHTKKVSNGTTTTENNADSFGKRKANKSTNKLYLETVWLTFNSLYKFYESECKNNEEIPLSYKTFSQITVIFVVDSVLEMYLMRNTISMFQRRLKQEKEIDKTSEGGIYIDAATYGMSEGGITSNEFSSIICDFISSKSGMNPNEIVILYSDGCTYQNRNSTLSSALSNLSQELNITIIQKYLERGHT
ncbi:hypothetical protein PR048_021470 [Dryococelus australis]|uniref:VWFA domain-containing protein n=1 Tax=Dryococelus australis TaxID=614101 RepID=A0ABQ9GY98_9NEOP|nr:hypothetical protein PR048_021470 [Dryococelus australis]